MSLRSILSSQRAKKRQLIMLYDAASHRESGEWLLMNKDILGPVPSVGGAGDHSEWSR